MHSTSNSGDRLKRYLPHAVVILLLVLLLLAIGRPVFREVREQSHRSTCKSNLRAIGLALQAYHEQYQTYPPAYVRGPDEKKWHSWRVLLLPFLNEEQLYREYRWDEPWNGPHNKTLAARLPAVYGCPAFDGVRTGKTTYLAVVGPAAAWPEYVGLSQKKFYDGISNTIQIIDWGDSDVSWMEPRDLPHNTLTAMQQVDLKYAFPKHHENLGVLFADGHVRSISPAISPTVFRGLLTPNRGAPAGGVVWPPELMPSSGELPAARSAAEFPNTDLIAHPVGPIVRGRNYVYCSTFEIAWSELPKLLGGPVQLEGDAPLARALNAHSFPRSSLSPQAFVARAGFVKDGIVEAIRTELAQKFPNAPAELLSLASEPHQVVAYAYLQKSLPFGIKFTVLPQALRFHGASGDAVVRSFGVERHGHHGGPAPMSQVTVADYVSDDDFVIKLDTTAGDEIVLAKIAPEKSLAATIAAVQKRLRVPLKQTIRDMTDLDQLAIPKLVIGIRQSYDELHGRHFRNAGWEDYYIAAAQQLVRFRLDESGAELVSEAAIVGENGHSTPSRETARNFVFDRPFLIFLTEPSAEQPYFAAWVENAELMEIAQK